MKRAPLIVLIVVIGTLFISFLLITSASYSAVVVNKEINARVCYVPETPKEGYSVEEETPDRYWFVVSNDSVYSWVEVDEATYYETDIGDYISVPRKLN